ncbi:FAD-NAD(P)-binding [Amycolatopsis xylanica]|uniref:FAD-NAD(P)-binding n=1 Tax=Amycolatopsis xylanica TaxID=589385 RepID=A0A1H2WAH5_9PSEU|nr:FAD/NAD(P)-binding protein [Amycolatopsis xylanica]SDW77518.1 FAD-NAD(P)-binding [Amycolatopsis xylanica]
MSAICVIGLGPRGLSVLERLCANASGLLTDELVIHLVDPSIGHGGQVWRTGQHPDLLMNTVTSQVTLFGDASVECDGPIVPGPSLYEWAQFSSLLGPFDRMPQHLQEEARRLGPDSYPSRAFYGQYLTWVLDRLVKTVPAGVRIVTHPVRAVDVADEPGGRQLVVLADGERLHDLDAVVLALGHTASELTEEETRLSAHAARHGLTYLPPANPADADLSAIGPGEPVVLRGMGLNFFDYLALFTTGRGGEFVRGRDGRLTYQASGREPVLITGSRRGVPYHARGENQKGAFGRHVPLFLTEAVIAALRARADRGSPVDFAADLWPLIDREVKAVYYQAVITARACSCDAVRFLREFSALPVRRRGNPLAAWPDPDENALLSRFGVRECDRWDWARIARPGAERFASAAEHRAWLLEYLREDVRAAKQGNVTGPVKAALDVLRDLRNEIRLVVDHGRLSGDSYRDDLQGWYTPLNAFLSIGPPAERIEQLIALIEAGLVTVTGPGLRVECGDGAFVARSAGVPGEHMAAVLIEARLPEPDLRATKDPLLAALYARGACTTHRIPTKGGGWYRTGGVAVTGRPYHLVDSHGLAHPRRFAFGVPTETVHWVTAAGIRPGVNSVIIADADAIARAGLLAAARRPVRSLTAS